MLKQLVIYGRCIVDGELKRHFLGMRDLFNGTAQTIIETSLVQFLQGAGLSLSNVSSFCSDGANVMTGRQNGVATHTAIMYRVTFFVSYLLLEVVPF